MAEEKKPAGDKPAPTKDTVSDAAWVILGILLFMYALSSMLSFFGQKNTNVSGGWRSFTPRGQILSMTRPISSLENPIGSRFIVTSNTAEVFATPGGRKISSKHLGDKGRIVGGPVTKDGEKYWQVKFDDGTLGWVAEKDIANLPQKLTPMANMPSLIGSAVETSKEADVFASPGKNKINSKPIGSRATIIEGPIINNGIKYWHVKFDDGTEGWVKESDLNSLRGNKPKPLSKEPSLIGGNVSVSKNGSEVYDYPGGNVVATKNIGQSGKIIEGPLVINGVKYWHIKFDDGTDGWVSENDLNYVEEVEPGLLFRIILFIYNLVWYIKYILVLMSIVLLCWLIYLYRGLIKIRELEDEKYYPKGTPEVFPEQKIVNPFWEKIEKLMGSENENDWRHAIIEADIMLSDLLENMHLPGETIGDKLKAVEKSDFVTLDNAWEAHKIRNQIAHDGSSFVLSQREAKRVIALFRTIFEEFHIVEKQ